MHVLGFAGYEGCMCSVAFFCCLLLFCDYRDGWQIVLKIDGLIMMVLLTFAVYLFFCFVVTMERMPCTAEGWKACSTHGMRSVRILRTAPELKQSYVLVRTRSLELPSCRSWRWHRDSNEASTVEVLSREAPTPLFHFTLAINADRSRGLVESCATRTGPLLMRVWSEPLALPGRYLEWTLSLMRFTSFTFRTQVWLLDSRLLNHWGRANILWELVYLYEQECFGL